MKQSVKEKWKHWIPELISVGIYYLVALINPAWYESGHEIGIIVSALVAEFLLRPKEEWKQYPASLHVKIWVAHGIVFLLEGLLLFLTVEKLGISIWIAPLINAVCGSFVQHLLETYFVKREPHATK